MTEEICRPIEGRQTNTGGIFHHCLYDNDLGITCLSLYHRYRNRKLGCKQNSRLGLGYHQLRLVDRYWSRRYADLRDLVAVPSALENVINRSAEAMTIFAVCCAGLFPIFHTGRPWLDYWMLPFRISSVPVGELQLPSLGRICDLYLLLRILWYSGISVYCLTLATVRDRCAFESYQEIYLRITFIRLERKRVTGIVLKKYHWYLLVCQHHLYFPFTPSYPSTSRLPLFRDGIQQSSCLISLPVRFSPVSPWY